MLPITQNSLLLCSVSTAPDWRLISVSVYLHTWNWLSSTNETLYLMFQNDHVTFNKQKHKHEQEEHLSCLLSLVHGVTALCFFFFTNQSLGDDKNGTHGVCQDKAAVMIVFLCTSSSVSHYCVQTRGNVYSAETSKSTALGCNLVTSFLPPAASSPSPLTAMGSLAWCCC